MQRRTLGAHRSRRRAAAAALALTLGAFGGGAPAFADCIGEESFNSFTTDVAATNHGAFVMYGSANAEKLDAPLSNHGEESATTLLYSLPPRSGKERRINLDAHGSFTSAPTLFADGGSVRTLAWREGPAKGKTAILGGLAGRPLSTVLSPAGSPGFAPLAVTPTSSGGYVMVVPAPGGTGPATLQLVNADGSLGASAGIGVPAEPDPAATALFTLTQASDGAIWVAGNGLIGRWMPGSSFSALSVLPAAYEMSAGAEGSVWVLTEAVSGSGTMLTHAGPSGIISQQHIPSQEGASMASGEELPMVALASRPDGTAVVAYGTFHGAFLESTSAAGMLEPRRRLSKQEVFSIEDLDLQPGTGTPFVSVTSNKSAAIYAVSSRIRVTMLPGVSKGFESVRATLGFAPDRNAWVVWTVRRGSSCEGTERGRSVWATLGTGGHLSAAHDLGEGSQWIL
jgi:hypothetical protein